MAASKAYSQRVMEGILLRKRGRPMMVAALKQSTGTPEQHLEPQLKELWQAAQQLGIDAQALSQVVADYMKKENGL